MKYKFKYKRIGSWFWSSKLVIGHGVDRNRLILYFEDLSLLEVPKFDDLEILLGTDWKLHVKSQMEKETNNTIEVKLNS